MKQYLGLLLMLSFSITQAQTSGTLDPNFGNGGKLIKHLLPNGNANAMAVDPIYGKIVVAATAYQDGSTATDIMVLRFFANGKPDTTFNGTGINFVAGITPTAIATDIAVDNSGRIVVTGNIPSTGQFVVARFSPNGLPDNTFGINGVVKDKINLVYSTATANCIISGDGIAVCGYVTNSSNLTQAFIHVLTNTGAADNTFNTNSVFLESNSAGQTSILNDIYYNSTLNAVFAGGSIKETGVTPKVLFTKIGLTASTVTETKNYISPLNNSSDTAIRIAPYNTNAVILSGNTNGTDVFLLFLSVNNGTIITGYGSNGIGGLAMGGTTFRLTAMAPSHFTSNKIFIAGSTDDPYNPFFMAYMDVLGGTNPISIDGYYNNDQYSTGIADMVPNPNGNSLSPDFYFAGTQYSLPDSQSTRVRLMNIYETGAQRFFFANAGDTQYVYGYRSSTLLKLLSYKKASDTSRHILALGTSAGTVATAASLNRDGSDNLNYGVNGRVAFNAFGKYGTVGHNAVVKNQATDTILIAINNAVDGNNRAAVARYNSDKIINSIISNTTVNFSNRKVNANGIAYDSSSNTFLIAGDDLAPTTGSRRNLYFARYHANDGSLDYSFSFDGLCYEPEAYAAGVNNVILSANSHQPIATGFVTDTNISTLSRQAALFKLNIDGTADNSFGTNGIAYSLYNEQDAEFKDLVEQPDGKIVAVGYSYTASNFENILVVRFNADGSIDSSFSGAARNLDIAGRTDMANSVLLLPDSRIAVGGYIYNGSNTDFFVFVLNPDGTFDSTFSNDGKVFIDFNASTDLANTMVLADSNTILIGGSTTAETPNGDYAMAAIKYYSAGPYTGIGETGQSDRISIYPNPAQDYLNVLTPSLTNKVSAGVVNMMGQRIICPIVSKGNNTTINIASLPEGIYMAEVIIGNNTIYKRFIKTN